MHLLDKNNKPECSTSSFGIGGAEIIECVPNFSEGRDKTIIDQIVAAIHAVQGVKVLHVDMGYDANRTVLTFAGSPEGVEEAAFMAVKKAAELIDMRQQTGTHPRMGAVDVFPIIPVSAVCMGDCLAISKRLTRRIGEALAIPVFNYEYSSEKPYRKRLEQIRQGEYEGLEQKMKHPGWLADNQVAFNARSGATVMGARSFLLAYNVNLKSRDVSIAKEIASLIRESGKVKKGERVAGLFQGVKAIGWDVPEFDMVQVSTNITNTERVGLHEVYEMVKKLAAARGVAIGGSELIGLSPKRCLLESGSFYGGGLLSEKESIALAIEKLGLTQVDNFKAEERIIEYLLQ